MQMCTYACSAKIDMGMNVVLVVFEMFIISICLLFIGCLPMHHLLISFEADRKQHCGISYVGTYAHVFN